MLKVAKEEPLKAQDPKGARARLQYPYKQEKKGKKKNDSEGEKDKPIKPEKKMKKDSEGEEEKPPRKRRKKAPSSTTGSDSGLATSPAREDSPEYNEVTFYYLYC